MTFMLKKHAAEKDFILICSFIMKLVSIQMLGFFIKKLFCFGLVSFGQDKIKKQ